MTEAQLRSVAEAATKAISHDGELPLRTRRLVRDAFEEVTRVDRAWAAVEIIAAQRAAGIWSSCFPVEDVPITLLAEAKDQLLYGSRNVDERRLQVVHTYLDDKFLLGDDFFAGVYAGFACWSAARSVLNGRPFFDVDSEQELDPLEWDAPFMASLAYSGGAAWEPGVGSTQRRREFWLWFLNDGLEGALSLLRLTRQP